MRRLALAATLAAAVVGTACSSGNRTVVHGPPPPPFYQPEIALRNVRFAGAGITGGVMNVALRVHNPNDYALRAPRVALRVLVDDHEVGDGEYDSSVEVAPRDSTIILVPVHVGYKTAAATATRGARSMLGDGMVNYRVVGRIHVGTPYGRFSSPYDRNGRFAPMVVRMGAR